MLKRWPLWLKIALVVGLIESSSGLHRFASVAIAEMTSSDPNGDLFVFLAPFVFGEYVLLQTFIPGFIVGLILSVPITLALRYRRETGASWKVAGAMIGCGLVASGVILGGVLSRTQFNMPLFSFSFFFNLWATFFLFHWISLEWPQSLYTGPVPGGGFLSAQWLISALLATLIGFVIGWISDRALARST